MHPIWVPNWPPCAKRPSALEPGGIRSKLLLPNDQIKYISLDSPRLTEADVRAALAGATPYALDRSGV